MRVEVRATLEALLGSDAELYELAAMVSDPGARRQPVHPDTPIERSESERPERHHATRAARGDADMAMLHGTEGGGSDGGGGGSNDMMWTSPTIMEREQQQQRRQRQIHVTLF